MDSQQEHTDNLPNLVINYQKNKNLSKSEEIFGKIFDKCNEVEYAYKKLLKIEYMKELELKEDFQCISSVNDQCSQYEDQELLRLKMNLQEINEDIAQIMRERTELKRGIQELQDSIPVEMQKFKDQIKTSIDKKKDLKNTLETLKIKRVNQTNSLQTLLRENKFLKLEIEKYDDFIKNQDREKLIPTNKIIDMKLECLPLQNVLMQQTP